MIKLQRTYVMLVALSLVFVGCDKLIYDQQESEGGADHKVHLSVNVRAAQPKSGLRAAEEPSINTDEDHFEDYVYDLAMLVFNSDGGQRVGIVHLNNSLGKGESTHAFKVELTANKTYDFYFVANMPDMRDDLTEANIPNREAMDKYLSATRELSSTLYQGASDKEKEGFPMARIYKNQLVEAGGTIYQPKPFYPKQGSSEEYSVVATSAGTGDDTRDYVELIRVVAKLEVNLDLDEETSLGVKKVYFRNANRHFRLVEFDTPPAEYFNDNSKKTEELRRLESSNTYIYYMPEAMISSVTWNSEESSNQQPINYFTIVTLDGTEYDIPIISNETSITSDYLEKAKGTSGYTPDYTIHRNHHYKYIVRNLEQIEVIYEVEPWNLVERHTYLGYGYNVHIDEKGKVTVNNTVDACPPHEIKLVAINDATFEGGPTDKVKVFKDYRPGAISPDYQLNNIPSSGEYLQVWYNDILVKTFRN